MEFFFLLVIADQFFVSLVTRLSSPCLSIYAAILSSLGVYSPSLLQWYVLLLLRDMLIDVFHQNHKKLLGNGWFNVSLTCSIQRSFCSSAVTSTFPFWSLTVFVCIVFCPSQFFHNAISAFRVIATDCFLCFSSFPWYPGFRISVANYFDK